MEMIEINSATRKIIDISLPKDVYSFYEKESKKCSVHNVVVPIGYYLAVGTNRTVMQNMFQFNEFKNSKEKDTLAFMCNVVAKYYNQLAVKYKNINKRYNRATFNFLG